MLSIIIPVLDEEKYLPLLLKSIKKQNLVQDYEVIVADAGSEDRTIEIAKSFGCRIIKGGLPAVGRNNGAISAKGDLFLFLDADIVLSENFLENSLSEFGKRKLAVASYCLIPRTKNFIFKIGFDIFYNKPIFLAQRFLAHGAMGILVKKEIFDKLGGGFDETIKLAEDQYFARMASKFGKFGIIKSAKIFITLRRFEQDGYLKTIFKYILCGFYLLFGKAFRSDALNYRFGHYSKKEK
ncbi:MAG: glycosyltransferase [Candidatus Nealsonbacteria bacterium]|nr:glycosyltransferase [Candidatus Nealsonbacteria bacterium]